MKYLNLILAMMLVAMGVYAAQDSALSIRQVRDPVQLRDKINANAADAESRIAAVEAAGVGGALASASIIVGNSGGTGAAVAVTGDITLSNAGVVAIASGVIVNADVATNAAIVATKISGTAVTYATAAQADTNASTTATAYVPAFVGQVLVGATGSTSSVWIAKGVTTNDWVQVQ